MRVEVCSEAGGGLVPQTSYLTPGREGGGQRSDPHTCPGTVSGLFWSAMKVWVLGGFGGESPDCRMTNLLINGGISLDAGSLTQALTVEQQVGVRAIVLTHSHSDHISSIPFFLENVLGRRRDPIEIYASDATIYALRKHMFNDSIWPDLSRIPNHLLPVVNFHELREDSPTVIDGVTFTPISVDHTIPTFGFLIEQNGDAILWSSDTGPTIKLWEVANFTQNLAAIFLETSFDNSLQRIADVSQHLTPNTLRTELEKLERDVPVYLHHMKPPSVDRIRSEVTAMGLPNVGFIEQGKRYEF